MYTKVNEIILENNNPKVELNHVLVNEKHIVSTDTRIIIIQEHNESVEEPYLKVNDKAKFKIDIEGISNGVPSNNTWSKSYPSYERILTKDPLINNHVKEEGFIDCLYRISSEIGIMFDYIKYASKFKKIDKELGYIDSYLYTDYKGVLTLHSGNYTIIIMPLITKENRC